MENFRMAPWHGHVDIRTHRNLKSYHNMEDSSYGYCLRPTHTKARMIRHAFPIRRSPEPHFLCPAKLSSDYERRMWCTLTNTGRQFVGGPRPIWLTKPLGSSDQLEPGTAMQRSPAPKRVAFSCHPAVRQFTRWTTWSSWRISHNFINENILKVFYTFVLSLYDTYVNFLRSHVMSGPYQEACPSMARHLALGNPFVTYPVWQWYWMVASKSKVACSGRAEWRACSMWGGVKQ